MPPTIPMQPPASPFDTPRTRRLKSDVEALQKLAAESSIFSFESFGSPPDFYILRFRGRGLWRADPQSEVRPQDQHEVHIRLGAAYPRLMPELAWKSPIFHPNISLSGVVCLGGYGTYWVPSLALADLCSMLWDMARYANYDESSPYNREAAAWAKTQTSVRLPVDSRPLRDQLSSRAAAPKPISAPPDAVPRAAEPEIVFLGDLNQQEIIEAELAPAAPRSREGVLYIG